MWCGQLRQNLVCVRQHEMFDTHNEELISIRIVYACITVGARYFSPVRIGYVPHPASYTVGPGLCPGVYVALA